MTMYEKIYSFNVLDEIVNGERILLIDRKTESINGLGAINAKALAIALKYDNKDNRFEFYKAVKVNE